MSENTAEKKALDTQVAEMVKSMSSQMDLLLDRVEKLDKSEKALISRLKKIESGKVESNSAASLIAFEDFEKALVESKNTVYAPIRVGRLASPVRLSVVYKPSEPVIEKSLDIVRRHFEFNESTSDVRKRYEALVNEKVIELGLATELREVTKKMNLIKASPLRKAIYAHGYAWALFELFTQYKTRINTMIEDSLGFTQRVITQLESESDGPVTVFAKQAVALTMQRNKICSDEELTHQVALSLKDKL